MTREQARRTRHQDEWLHDGGLDGPEVTALVLNVLWNVERDAQRDRRISHHERNGFHTSRERTGGRSAEPRPNDAESVITQSARTARDARMGRRYHLRRKEIGAAWTNWLLDFGSRACERRNCIAFARLRKVNRRASVWPSSKKSSVPVLHIGLDRVADHVYDDPPHGQSTDTASTAIALDTPPPTATFATPVHHLQRADSERLDRSVPADAASRTNAHAATVTPLRTPLRDPLTPTAPKRTPPCGQMTPTQRQQICPRNHRAPQAKWPCTEERRSEQEGGYGDEPNETRLSEKLASGEGDWKSWTPST